MNIGLKKRLLIKGQAMLVTVVFFLFLSLAIVLGVSDPIIKTVGIVREAHVSRQSYNLSEALIEDMVYRYKTGKLVSNSESLTIGQDTASATSTTAGDEVVITSTAVSSGSQRKLQTKITSGEGFAFNYGVQAGDGGVELNNSSSIVGNLFSNGPIEGADNVIQGDVISAGPAGLIDDIHATSSAYAHTIQNSTIDKDAYYVVKTNTSVAGISYPNSTDQATSSLPISDAQIEDWKTEAAAGGVHSSPCPYNLHDQNITIGPKKINCDLNVSGSSVITLSGPVWVNGDITFSNTTDVKVDSSVGNKSVALIADETSNQNQGGKIYASNSVEFIGNGNSNSYIVLISQNRGAENGLSDLAITFSNSANGKVILFAGHGTIALSNTVSLKEVTAYKIELNNSAKVTYESGIANLLFSSGPSGGYVINSWKEIE